MSAPVGTTGAPTDGLIETPSGKGAGDENFPVASRLIKPALRPHVMAFYDFVRAADDIADNPDLAPAEKVARLDAMDASLTPDGPLTKPRRLAATFEQTGVTDRHARAMLSAFRQDATKTRYADLAELWDYCDRSAVPVGLFLVDLHSEDPAAHRGAAALSAVLQILNHLQDCADDYRALDRVYLPQDLLAANGATVADLDGPAATPGLRATFDTLLDACERRLSHVDAMPALLRDSRFRAEVVVVRALAWRLAHRLRRDDPVAGRVALSKVDFGLAAAKGLRSFLSRR